MPDGGCVVCCAFKWRSVLVGGGVEGVDGEVNFDRMWEGVYHGGRRCYSVDVIGMGSRPEIRSACTRILAL